MRSEDLHSIIGKLEYWNVLIPVFGRTETEAVTEIRRVRTDVHAKSGITREFKERLVISGEPGHTGVGIPEQLLQPRCLCERRGLRGVVTEVVRFGPTQVQLITESRTEAMNVMALVSIYLMMRTIAHRDV